MNNQEEKNSIAEKIISKIKKGEIKMKSKLSFILKITLLAVLSLALAFFVACLVGFIIFSLRASGAWYLPAFGFRAFGAFLHSIPWILILAVVALFIGLEMLILCFSFSYRRPIIYSILGIAILIILGGLIVDKTHLHPFLFDKAQRGRLPIMDKPYRDFGMPEFPDFQRGVVLELTDQGFSMENPKGEILNVIFTSGVKIPPGINIGEKDSVVVLGEKKDNTIEAAGVHKINDKLDFFPKPKRKFFMK